MPSTYAFSKPTYGIALDANPFGVTFYVSNTTNPTEDQGSPGTTAQGRTPKNPFTSITTALSSVVAGRGDTIVLQRGTYTENVNFNKAGVTVRAANTYGYPDHVVITGTSTCNASNTTFIGIEFFSNSSTAASMTVGNSTEADSVVFLDCSFASDGTTEPRYGLRYRGGNNQRVERCRFVDNAYAFVCHSGLTSLSVSGLTVKDCEFLENTTLDFGNLGTNNPSDGSQYAIKNLTYIRNCHSRGEVAVTDFINITDTEGSSSGIMSHNLFANATNASGVITIPSTLFYGPNGTEAGWSSARPA